MTINNVIVAAAVMCFCSQTAAAFYESCDDATPNSYGKGCDERDKIIARCISSSKSKTYDACVKETRAEVRRALNPNKEEIARFEEERKAYMSAYESRKKAEEAAKYPPAYGMTKEQVEKSSWGKPEKINTTTSKESNREQWVYGDGNYLYFINGRLESAQTSRLP